MILRQFEHSSEDFFFFLSGRADSFGVKPHGSDDRERSENQQRHTFAATNGGSFWVGASSLNA